MNAGVGTAFANDVLIANLAPRRDFGAPTAVAADPMHLVSSDNRADVPLPCFAREQGRRDRALLRADRRSVLPAERADLVENANRRS